MTAALLVRIARRSAGLTQAEVAARCRMTQPEIARLEGLQSNPTMATVEQVLRATGHRLAVEPMPPSQVDETQIAERLRLSPAERLRMFQASQRNLSRLLAGAQRVRTDSR